MIFWGRGTFFHLGDLQFMLGDLVIVPCWIEKLQPHDILTHLWEAKCQICAFWMCFWSFLQEVVQYIWRSYLQDVWGQETPGWAASHREITSQQLHYLHLLSLVCSPWGEKHNVGVEICLVALLKRLNLHRYWLCMYPSTTIIRENIFSQFHIFSWPSFLKNF